MSKNREAVNSTEMFFRNVPKEVKKKFKAWCVTEGITMSEAIVILMDWVTSKGKKIIRSEMGKKG